MMCRLQLGLLLAVLAGFTLMAAEPEPSRPTAPARLQKKVKPRPPETAPEQKPAVPPTDKQEDKEKTPPSKPATQETDQDNSQETLARLARNLHASEERLAKADTSASTRQLQRDVLQDLDHLLKQGREGQSPNSPNSGQG
ncbi:MAG: hypothetical protein JO112_03405, partial [Planctomycetes bacterium]|nr:hypothetical protein [Planctomycetota bacterium]